MLIEPDELKRASEMDPTILEFVQKNPSPPIDWNDETAFKALFQTVEATTLAQLGPPESTLVETEQDIPMRDGYASSMKIHKPATPPPQGSPLIVLLFGGGFIGGSKHQMTPNARAMVRAFGAVVVNLSYRLAPQHKFPTAINDCWDGIKWLAAHARELGADPTKGFVVGGVSAGGLSSAVMCTLAAEEKLNPPLTGAWLSVPAIFDDEGKHVPEKYRKYYLSHQHNAEAPVLDQAAMDALTMHNEWDLDSPLRIPVLSKAPLSQLPPTYFQACGMDPIRDHALVYEEMLKQAGVKTRIDHYPGCPHAHFAFFPGLEVTNKANSDIIVNVGWLLGKEISAEEGLKAYEKPA
ncbi:lipase/esterase [Hortaea werneckii]|nr:lipase/esterase [Hortaea werneckii]